MQQTDYTSFNPTTAQSATNHHPSLYDVPSACFVLYMAVLMEVFCWRLP